MTSRNFNTVISRWPNSARDPRFFCTLTCIIFATLAITSYPADSLLSSASNLGLGDSINDRVQVIKSTSSSPSEFKKGGKESFKEVFDKLTIQVKENTPIGSKLADIQTDDQDSKDSQIIYAIVSGQDKESFTLHVDNNNKKVELVNQVNFDFESPKKNYQVLIRALSIYLRYEVDVDIIVTDENDNKPQLDDFAIVLNNYRNHFPTGPIGRVPASDLDINDQLRYRVLSGNNAQLVVVNETSGDIQLSPWLNSNVPMRALILVAVSDGMNEAVAHMVLTVNLVTEAMLQNSVVVRLDGIGRDDFLTKKYDTFVKDITRILGTNVVVFDVEESLQESTPHDTLTYRTYNGSSIINSTLSVNVSFSARDHGNDVEMYLTSQYIEERVDLNRAHLMQSLDVNVALFQDNLCNQEPCPNYQKCVATYRFDRAPKTFISARNILFRPIRAVQSFSCVCPPTPGNSSICGACNCDESKGFDLECDKTNGQCFCKPNYYPVGSDYCLACDCYMVGSLSASCNQTTGQCKCRPGVVGRRCDTCASDAAEVTLRGCEVVYDACPKTFSDGIWWEKTQPGKYAYQECPPSTSTGTASRYCIGKKDEGWQKANMFDCISNTFTDLYNHFQVFEEKKFTMTSELAMKIAVNLRQALNETISNPSLQLYGSDMYVSFRLLHHLIQHELKQTGLNLTHRQDRQYIRNIAESISYILDPANADNWAEISLRSPDGGAEYFLKLIDSYGKVLIESQSDTFTQPFEVSTKYFTFGMDIMSTDQLWDLSRTSTFGGLNQSSPPYATDPFGPPVPIPTLEHPSPKDTQANYNNDGSSVYLDYSSSAKDTSPSIMIPKYDNYALDSTNDDATKALIPLKTLRIKTIQELMPQSYYQARSRAKREELIIPEFKLVRQQPALVVYSIYKSLGPLLPNYADNTVQHRLGINAIPNSPVIWLTIRPTNSSDFLNKNIQPKITYMLKMVEPAGKTRPQCAIWDFAQQVPLVSNGNKNQTYGKKQTGKFTTKGCELKGVHPNHKLRYKYDYVNCSCDHLGAVTVLMDSANYDYLSTEDTNVKDLAMIIALGISLAILLLASFILSCIRGHSIKSNSNSINKNLLFVLIAIELLILYTFISRSSLNQREYQCKLVAIFLHYFSISLFFWLLVNAIHFYRMLTELRDINHGPMKFYHVLGYAIPAFFVSIAVGLRIEQFGNYLFCWLSIHEAIIWSMFGPISFVSLVTVVLFLLALAKSLPVKENSSGADLVKNHMIINIVKTPLIGVFWLITVYAVNEAFSDLVYLYPIIIVIKSLALFVLLCIVDKHIRYNLYVSWLRFRGEKVAFMEESMNYNSPTAQWMPPQLGGLPGQINKNYAYASHNGQITTPGFQSSCTDIFRPEVLAFSADSTTSHSSATGTSSSAPYQYRSHRVKERTLDEDYGRSRSGRHRRRHKKSHRRHHHHHKHHHHHHHRSHHHNKDDYDPYTSQRSQQPVYGESNSNSQHDLASSHSSDDGDMSTMPKKTQIYGSNPTNQTGSQGASPEVATEQQQNGNQEDMPVDISDGLRQSSTTNEQDKEEQQQYSTSSRKNNDGAEVV